MSKNVVVEKEVQEMVGQMWSMEKGVKTKKSKLNKPQGTSRTDTSLSPFLIFKKKADGDGWCEIVQHKGAWNIGWDVEDPGSGPEDEVWEDLKVEGKDKEFGKRRNFGLVSTIEEFKGIVRLPPGSHIRSQAAGSLQQGGD